MPARDKHGKLYPSARRKHLRKPRAPYRRKSSAPSVDVVINEEPFDFESEPGPSGSTFLCDESGVEEPSLASSYSVPQEDVSEVDSKVGIVPITDADPLAGPPECELEEEDLVYFHSLAPDLAKLSPDQKMIFRIKIGNILQELVNGA